MVSCFKGKFKVTSPRGYRTISGKNEYHGGLDLVAMGNDKGVYAIADGVIDATPYEKDGFGYYVRQLLDDGKRVYYGHMAKGSIVVKSGAKIKKGEKLGTMGSSGLSTGAHTHIELRVKGTSKTSLDICAFTGIPNKCGVYGDDEVTLEEMEAFIKGKCSFEDNTMKYLKDYKYSKSLFEKLYSAMK